MRHILVLIACALLLASCSASAQPSKTPTAIVTFTFDDAPKSVVQVALPILQKYHYPATVYIATANAQNYPGYMNWDDIKKVADAGWEVGAHTYSHPDLSTLSDKEILADLRKSMVDFTDHGYLPVDFASPFGNINDRALAIIKQVYQSHRDAWPNSINQLPLVDPYKIAAYDVNKDTTLEELSNVLHGLQMKGGWIVLTLHEIVPKGATLTQQHVTNLLEDIVEQVHAEGFPVFTIREALSNIAGRK